MESLIVSLSELRNGEVFQFAQPTAKKLMKGEIKPKWRLTMEGELNCGIALEERVSPQLNGRQATNRAPLMISSQTKVIRVDVQSP